MQHSIGERTLLFAHAPQVVSSASVVSRAEGDGPLGKSFDVVLADDKLGEDRFEKAECRMFEQSVRLTCSKAGLQPKDLDLLVAGDLLNQIITANYGARTFGVPYLGLYGACSTMAESLLVASVLLDGGYRKRAACAACSHFSTAERQYRFPLEMGTTAPPTAQRTVTGAGCLLLAAEDVPLPVFTHVFVSAATIGKVVDLGINDANNMGAAMAPACCDTLLAHLEDTGSAPSDFDLIVSGDLGKFGAEMLFSLCAQHGVDLSGRHIDCGDRMYHPDQNYNCGGSGAGCSAVTLAGYLLPMLEHGDCSRILFLATGALMSPTSGLQGETIPAIAHAIVFERR